LRCATAIATRLSTLAAAFAVTVIAVAPTPSSRADSAPLYELVDAAAQRLQTADPVAAYKWATATGIEDPARVRQILSAVAADARDQRIDPAYVRQAFSDQIHATESIEYTRFAQWKLDPAGAPSTAPQLSASRATIDALNRRMVTEMADHWDFLHSPACAAGLADANGAVSASRQLDTVYQQALTFATRAYCG
jgi:chorismate mutase